MHEIRRWNLYTLMKTKSKPFTWWSQKPAKFWFSSGFFTISQLWCVIEKQNNKKHMGVFNSLRAFLEMVGSWMDFHICQFHRFPEKRYTPAVFFVGGSYVAPNLRSVFSKKEKWSSIHPFAAMLTFGKYRWLETPFGVCDLLDFVKKPLRLDHDSTIA